MEKIITAEQSWIKIDFKELRRYKDLFYFLTLRDIKVRYKQTAIGVLWAFFVPFITMVVFSVFFGNFVGVNSDGLPYPIFVFTGLVFWTFFSQALTLSSNSLVSSQSIIQKIYFPKILLPASAIFVSFIDFIIATIILTGMMIYYRFIPSASSIIIIPLLVLITYCTSLGLGWLLSAVNVRFRDVRYVVTFMIQMLLFLTPVIYPVSILGEQYSWILYFNPMAGVIETSRAVLMGQTSIPWDGLITGAIVSLVLLVVGLFYFKKTERFFADII